MCLYSKILLIYCILVSVLLIAISLVTVNAKTDEECWVYYNEECWFDKKIVKSHIQDKIFNQEQVKQLINYLNMAVGIKEPENVQGDLIKHIDEGLKDCKNCK